MENNRNRSLVSHLFAIISVVAWGTSFLISKTLMEHITPVQMMWLRFIIAYLAMWAICPKWHFRLKEEGSIFVLALVGNTLYFLAENTALKMTQASNVSILVSTAPVFSALLARFLRQGDRLSRWQIFGYGIAFFGVLLVVFNGVFVLKFSPVGDALALAAAFLWAAYGFIAKWSIQESDSALVTRKLMFYGILTTMPLLFMEGETEIFSVFGTLVFGDIWRLLYLGLICSALCYLLWNKAIEQIGPLKTNLYVYAVPLVTMLASALFQKEIITSAGFAGIVLVVGGMVMSNLEYHSGTSRTK